MSSNDGNYGTSENIYRYQQQMNHDLNIPQHQHDAATLHHQMMWTNHGILPPQTYIPTTPQQTGHFATVPTAPPQTRNEYVFNMHPMQAYVQPAGQTETYSVLPVGHGNFLKVYHCNDNISGATTAAAEIPSGNIFQQPTYQHQPLTPQQQYQQIPTTINTPTTPTTTPPSPPQTFNSYELFSSTTLLPAKLNTDSPTSQSPPPPQLPQQQIQPQQNATIVTNAENNNKETSTTMIINKLVNNWSPNLTGGTYTQFGGTTTTTAITPSSSTTTTTLQTATIIPECLITESIVELNVTPPPTPKITKETTSKLITNNLNTTAPEIKKRIVAEVKPMRMTYSDVLSKINHANQPQTTLTIPIINGLKSTQQKNGKPLGTAAQIVNNNERKMSEMNIPTTTNANRQRNEEITRVNKKSPIHEQKDSSLQNKSNKRINTISSSSTTTASNNNNNNNNNKLNGQKTINITANNIKSTNETKIKNNKTTNTTQKDTKENKKPAMNTANANTEKEQTYYERFTASRKTYNNKNNNNNSVPMSTSYTRTRYANANNSYASGGSYSYSSKRNRGASYYHTSASMTTYGSYADSSTNRNYELAKKLLHTWCEYTLKVLTWLFYLVYDIVVIGCGMAYERLTQSAIAAWAQVRQLRIELQQNSNKPGLWWRNYWRRFDARFAKQSRWAFWRRFYSKKPMASTNTETFKGGRLPQTGEEAMYSLLNCKGKNAYSILGVPPNSSQEQIRKHYKKIAVLVHPDKNKQAGAEEAFKVLQRAFELIGEPENRHAYDQGLAEALHAEKAWTEFHDLLSQLHTKITEAANTIRYIIAVQSRYNDIKNTTPFVTLTSPNNYYGTKVSPLPPLETISRIKIAYVIERFNIKKC